MDRITAKYNVPVPRYTSYPAANFFAPSYTKAAFVHDLEASHTYPPHFYSFYIHIPFCHTLCHYCGCNALPMCRRSEIDRYIDSVLRHLDLILPHLSERMPVAQIHYGGGSPTSIPIDRLRRINEQISAAFPISQGAEIAVECHPGYLDLDDWGALVDAGFNRLSIGVQDFDESVLRAVGRKPSRLPLADVVALLHRQGVGVNLDFIYGLTGQTPTGFTETIKKAIALEPERVVTFSYAHLPWLNPRMKKLEEGVGLPTPEVKEQLRDLAARLFREAGYVPIGMDHYVRPDDELAIAAREGILSRNFQGYCTRRTTGQVIALGNTGISQLSRCFAQSVKDLDTYMQMVSDGHIPIERGYALSPDEAARGALITQLMCNYRVSMADARPLMEHQTQEILDEMQQDRLIEMNDEMLSVTSSGRVFVRNVAAAFDPHYRETDSPLYSRPV